MKKLVYMAIAMVVLFAANSCKEKKNTPVISANDSVEVEEVNDSTIYGVCGEGTSMHSLELCSDEGDTLSVFIDDANPSIVQGGLMAGDRIALLAYKAQDGEMIAQKVINLTSLLGKWISLDKNFDLLEGGEVKNNVKAETNPLFCIPINKNELVENNERCVFSIQPLTSMYQYYLINDNTGDMWKFQWSTKGDDYRWIERFR